MRVNRVLKWIPVLLILLFMFAPVIVVVLFSFHSERSTALPFEGFSFRWYDEVFADEEFRTAAVNSLQVAIVTVIFSVTVGTAAAFALARSGSKWLAAVSGLIVTPLVVPGLFLGLALLVSATEVGFDPSLPLVFVGHALITIPFVVLVMGTRLANFDWSILEAARDLGATPRQTFAKIMLPIIGPAIVGAALLTLAWSLDEFIITFFTSGDDLTLPVLIFSRTRTFLDPGINVIATVILVGTIIATGVAARFLAPSKSVG